MFYLLTLDSVLSIFALGSAWEGLTAQIMERLNLFD